MDPGKNQRVQTPREAHEEFAPGKKRFDPILLLIDPFHGDASAQVI